MFSPFRQGSQAQKTTFSLSNVWNSRGDNVVFISHSQSAKNNTDVSIKTIGCKDWLFLV